MASPTKQRYCLLRYSHGRSLTTADTKLRICARQSPLMLQAFAFLGHDWRRWRCVMEALEEAVSTGDDVMVEAEVEVLLRGIKCFVQLMELTIDKVLCESLYAVILCVT
jgi:hypothetical protein